MLIILIWLEMLYEININSVSHSIPYSLLIEKFLIRFVYLAKIYVYSSDKQRKILNLLNLAKFHNCEQYAITFKYVLVL